MKVLAERGIDGGDLELRVHESKKAQHRKTGVTNECDCCGKILVLGCFRTGQQKFCDTDCYHTACLRIAAVDVTDRAALDCAKALKAGPCPTCRKPRQMPEIYAVHYIASALILTTQSTETFFRCRSCATRKALRAMLYCSAWGWWSVHGLLKTPIRLVMNGYEILKRRDPSKPSVELIQFARMALADEQLRISGGGRWSGRPQD
ncbi:MAG: hypothetical protein ABI411_18145 [Tahibacter sp.]